MIGSNETKAPYAVQAFLSCIRRKSDFLLQKYVTADAKMSVVGFLPDAKNARIADVLKEVLPVDQTRCMSNVTMKTPDSWEVECLITRSKKQPIRLVAICNLDASGKISSISAEMEPSFDASWYE